MEVYRTEPYVLPADVYAHPDHQGRGGWSWYTGAAGWYYRVAVQELLGLNIHGGTLTVQPRLPESWPGYEADWKTETGLLHIRVHRGSAAEMRLDGEPAEGVVLKELNGTHELDVTVPG